MEVVVEGHVAPSASSTPASLTVLPLGPGTPPGTDLAEVLETVPGATVRRLGGLGDFAGISIRGSSFRQVEVFLDGVPLNPDGAAAVDLSEFPVTNLDRVEVYRGFAPPELGSAAMGGVVNLVTGDTLRTPTSVRFAAGSWGTERVDALASGRVKSVDALVAFDQLHTDGDWSYFDDQGTSYNLLDDRTLVREHNAIDRASALGRVRVGDDTLRLTLLDHYASLRQDLTGPISNPARQATWESRRNLLSAGLGWRPSQAWHVEPRVWWHRQEQVVDDREGEVGVGPDWEQDRFQALGAQARVGWAPAPELVLSALARTRWEEARAVDLLDGAVAGPHRRLAATAALSATAHAWRERVSLTPVLQLEGLDNRHLGEVPFEDTPLATEDTATLLRALPRAGLLVRPVEGLALKANAGRYLRAPDFTELFGSTGNLAGNARLRPEHGWGWAVGARWVSPAGWPVCFTVDADYARNHVHDLIAWVPNSQQTQQAQNLGEAYVRSTEGALSFDGWEVLATSTTVTWTLSRNLDADPVYANNQLPQVPPLDLSHRTEVRWRDRVSLAHTWTWTSATFSDPANTQRSAPRDIHGLALSLAPVRGLPVVRAEVLNLFDTGGMAVDRNPLDDADDTPVVLPLVDFAGYPLPGRTVMVSVGWDGPPKE